MTSESQNARANAFQVYFSLAKAQAFWCVFEVKIVNVG